jgi:hypothetical protein
MEEFFSSTKEVFSKLPFINPVEAALPGYRRQALRDSLTLPQFSITNFQFAMIFLPCSMPSALFRSGFGRWMAKPSASRNASFRASGVVGWA